MGTTSTKNIMSPSTSTTISSSLSIPSSTYPSFDTKKFSINSATQQHTLRRVSERNDDHELTLSSGNPSLEQQLKQLKELQLQLHQHEQRQKVLSRRVSDWNSIVGPDVDYNMQQQGQKKQQHYTHHPFECYLDTDEKKQKYRRRCSLGFVRTFERRGSLLHDGDEVCFNNKKFFFTTEY